MRSPYLEQLGSWGSATRDPRGWSTTHAYFSVLVLSDQDRSVPSKDCAWFPLKGKKLDRRLAFDHEEIVEAAVARFREKAEYTSLPSFLLPLEFTLSELQQTYELVLGGTLEKSAFRTRVLASQLLEPLQKYREGRNRPAQLFRLKRPDALVYFPRSIRGKD
jgi:hypothetical protein